jgi:light-regulated signal transduction histidine kinase (bacteriophytochrome)
MFEEDYGGSLSEDGARKLGVIRENAQKMGILIDDLLTLSRLGRKPVQKSAVNMGALVESVLLEIDKTKHYKAIIKTGDLKPAYADYSLIFQVMMNLLSNAIKYSSKIKIPLIEIGSEEKDKEIIYWVKDNGTGFDMKYSDKLFKVFQRLHSEEEFEGTGVGLAIVQRLISKHEGKVWAKGEVNKGAEFYFSLPK